MKKVIVNQDTQPLVVDVSTPALPSAVPPRQGRQVARIQKKPKLFPDSPDASVFQERCRQLSLALFLRDQAPVRSLGITSAVSGEGKTFLARTLAAILADDQNEPVTLMECSWNHPSLHESYGLAAVPGLAEWLRGECNGAAVRHRVSENLTIVPAGNADHDEVRLLRRLRHEGVLHVLAAANEFVIVDLPPIVSTGYGLLAASMVEALLVVVRAGVTPDHLIADACAQLKGLPVEGIVLNQISSRIPRWISQLI